MADISYHRASLHRSPTGQSIKKNTCRVENAHLPQPVRDRPAESKTGTYHERVGAGRRMAGPEKTSTVRFAQETSVPRSHQRTEDDCPELLFGSTNSLIRT